MDREDYIRDESWSGGDFELAIVWYPHISDEDLARALQVLWETPSLMGPWATPQDYLDSECVPKLAAGDEETRHFGLLKLQDSKITGCWSYVSEIWSRISDYKGGSLLALGVPFAMLDYPITYGLGAGVTITSNPWISIVDASLVEIADRIFREVPFDLASIGQEASHISWRSKLTTEDTAWGGYLLSPQLFEQLKPEVAWQVLPSGLIWIPPVYGKSAIIPGQ